MNFGICSLSVIPCRKEPASTSEMVTQLLFGETYTIIEEEKIGFKLLPITIITLVGLAPNNIHRITDSDYKS
jgi:hypothetical protein